METQQSDSLNQTFTTVRETHFTPVVPVDDSHRPSSWWCLLPGRLRHAVEDQPVLRSTTSSGLSLVSSMNWAANLLRPSQLSSIDISEESLSSVLRAGIPVSSVNNCPANEAEHWFPYPLREGHRPTRRAATSSGVNSPFSIPSRIPLTSSSRVEGECLRTWVRRYVIFTSVSAPSRSRRFLSSSGISFLVSLSSMSEKFDSRRMRSDSPAINLIISILLSKDWQAVNASRRSSGDSLSASRRRSSIAQRRSIMNLLFNNGFVSSGHAERSSMDALRRAGVAGPMGSS